MWALDPAIEVRAGTNVADVWDRFEVFEALHHSMRICNPMTSGELDELVACLDVCDDQVVVDFACGYGETLIRAAAQATIQGIGIDLSPWMVHTAHQEAQNRCPDVNLRWVLGEARDFVPAAGCDIGVCIGAEWVWHDFGGTARAMAQRLEGGGLTAIGAGRLHEHADPVAVAADRGRIETIDDQASLLEQHGFEPLHRIDPDDAGWDAYLARTAIAVAQWCELHPGERSETWRSEQLDWYAAREHDREVVGWSVWVARKR